MKRESIAETTLNKQYKNITQQIQVLEQEQANLETKIATLKSIQDDLQEEMFSLKQARVKASESRK